MDSHHGTNTPAARKTSGACDSRVSGYHRPILDVRTRGQVGNISCESRTLFPALVRASTEGHLGLSLSLKHAKRAPSWLMRKPSKHRGRSRS